MKVLITGISGFIGTYLAEYCLKQSCEVHGWVRSSSWKGPLETIKDRISIEVCNILDPEAVRERLDTLKPDWIFHLAGKSHIGVSWHEPQDTLQVNVSGQVNLLEAMRTLDLTSRIQIAGSSEEYGIVQPEEVPVTEDTPLRPISPYAVSKVSQDLMGHQYFKNYGLRIVRTRSFNQTGPRRKEFFVTSAFAKQVAMIEVGRQRPILHVGNIDVVRDFTDVRDTVKAYWLALKQCDDGEVYNICSGQGRKISDILDILRDLSEVKFEVKKDQTKIRPSDLPVMIGDGSKFHKKTGWKPQISLEESMQDLLNYWRENVGVKARAKN